MKIGEFAKVCHTRISVLRHYDRLGLLRPIYIVRFTEYRYYDASQAAVFRRISGLKRAGFTLVEIKQMLLDSSVQEELFARKRAELNRRLSFLDEMEKTRMEDRMMEQKDQPLMENIDLPFENDERVIGKWQIVGGEGVNLGSTDRTVYFLPDGQRYWGYSWTKGKFIVSFPDARYASDYRIEERGDELYMIINCKTPDTASTGQTLPIALRKLDSRRYTKQEIAKKDAVDRPFLPDERVIGRWTSCRLLRREDQNDFLSGATVWHEAGGRQGLFYREITFTQDGKCRSVFENRIEVEDSWTRGFVLNRRNQTACAYEIRSVDGTEYLLLEWKSGDYLWGGREPNFYVFVRAK